MDIDKLIKNATLFSSYGPTTAQAVANAKFAIISGNISCLLQRIESLTSKEFVSLIEEKYCSKHNIYGLATHELILRDILGCILKNISLDEVLELMLKELGK